MSKLKTYRIGLEIDATDRTNTTLRQIKNGFQDINKDLQNISVEDLNKNLHNIQRSMSGAVQSTEEATRYTKAYSDAVKKSVSELEKEATTLSYMMTEAGKADRKRLETLEKKAELTKDEQKELKALQKTVIAGSDEEIKKQLQINKQKRIALKNSQLEAQETVKHKKTLSELVKADLKGMKERLKVQLDFIKSLKTTEGRYKALKKLGGLAAKGAGLAVGGAVGMFAAGVGGAISQAQNQSEIERSLRAMKGIPEDQKRDVYSRLYVATGRSADEIVKAVNRVQSVLKTKDLESVVSSAISEIRFPGLATMINSSTGGGERKDFSRFESILTKYQGQFGLTESDVSQIINNISNKRLHGLSQEEYIKYYSALKGSGAFDSDETLERALAAFTRSADKTKSLDEQFSKYDFSRFVFGAQNKNQVKNSLAGLDISEDSPAVAKIRKWMSDNDVRVKSSSQVTAEKLRELEIKKNELLIKFMPIAEKIVSKFTELLNNNKLTKMIDGLIEFFSFAADKLIYLLETIAEFVTDGKYKPKQKTDGSNPGFVEYTTYTPAIQRSNGGITSGLELVGERGPELVIPLDYSRRGRATQIINNFNQNFNMGTQTTALSLSQAVRTQSFAQSLALNRR